MSFNLSYIIATRNRLPFLRILFNELLPQLKTDEEIVVIDGDSTDGTIEYLEQLLKEQKIHQYKSEPDRNQAEAWNKGMLMARGTIIKKLIDDDVHDFKAIRKCCDFMLLHPEIDVCISDTLECDLQSPEQITQASRLPWFLNWKAGNVKSFTFGDVYLLIRRSSLGFIGLYDTQFKMIDWEYSLRISFLGAKIAYYTGFNSLSVATPGNVTSTATQQQLRYEETIGKLKYNYAGDGADISFYSRIKITIGTLLAKGRSKTKIVPLTSPICPDELENIYAALYKKLSDQNATDQNWHFITNA
ncbi:MAG: glycosyltransferase family 2 protein [Mucilaginibacter sp.]